MRRKSERNKSKSSPEKKNESPKKGRRQSKRRKRSTSPSASDSDEAPLKVKIVTAPIVKEVSPTLEPKKSSNSNSDDENPEQPVWKVTPAEAEASGVIQKLKICLTRPPTTPERIEKSPRRRKHKSSTHEGSEDRPTRRRSRRGISPTQSAEDTSSQDNSYSQSEKEETLTIVKETNEVIISEGKLSSTENQETENTNEIVKNSQKVNEYPDIIKQHQIIPDFNQVNTCIQEQHIDDGNSHKMIPQPNLAELAELNSAIESIQQIEPQEEYHELPVELPVEQNVQIISVNPEDSDKSSPEPPQETPQPIQIKSEAKPQTIKPPEIVEIKPIESPETPETESVNQTLEADQIKAIIGIAEPENAPVEPSELKKEEVAKLSKKEKLSNESRGVTDEPKEETAEIKRESAEMKQVSEVKPVEKMEVDSVQEESQVEVEHQVQKVEEIVPEVVKMETDIGDIQTEVKMEVTTESSEEKRREVEASQDEPVLALKQEVIQEEERSVAKTEKTSAKTEIPAVIKQELEEQASPVKNEETVVKGDQLKAEEPSVGKDVTPKENETSKEDVSPKESSIETQESSVVKGDSPKEAETPEVASSIKKEESPVEKEDSLSVSADSVSKQETSAVKEDSSVKKEEPSAEKEDSQNVSSDSVPKPDTPVEKKESATKVDPSAKEEESLVEKEDSQCVASDSVSKQETPDKKDDSGDKEGPQVPTEDSSAGKQETPIEKVKKQETEAPQVESEDSSLKQDSPVQKDDLTTHVEQKEDSSKENCQETAEKQSETPKEEAEAPKEDVTSEKVEEVLKEQAKPKDDAPKIESSEEKPSKEAEKPKEPEEPTEISSKDGESPKEQRRVTRTRREERSPRRRRRDSSSEEHQSSPWEEKMHDSSFDNSTLYPKKSSPEERTSPDTSPSPEEERQDEIVPRRKKRPSWDRSVHAKLNFHTEIITSETILKLFPNTKMLSNDEIKLETSEEKIKHPIKPIPKLEDVFKPIAKPPMSPKDDDVDKEVSNIGLNRKISIVNDEASKLQPPPSPAKNPVSNVLFITNLVRPFTLKQLQELLSRTGSIKEDGFWTDRIKSKCYVEYETEEEAEATRNALHGIQWPIGNGKKLIIDFGTVEAMQAARNPTVAEPIKPLLEKVEEKEPEVKKDVSDRYEKDRSKAPVREWDLGKVPQEDEKKRSKSRDRDRNRDKENRSKDRSRSRNERSREREKRRHSSPTNGDVTERKQKKVEEEDVPAKLMDDLFRKTKATPSIYWLPLSPEQIAQKQQERLQRMAEHKRRLEESRTRTNRDFGRGAPRSRRRSGRFDND